MIETIVGLLGLALGAAVAFFYAMNASAKSADGKIRRAEEECKRIVSQAKDEAETQKKEILVNAKDEAMKLVAEREKEFRQQRQELVDIERRIAQREEKIEQRSEAVGKRENTITTREKELDEKHEQADQIVDKQRKELERIAGLNQETAKQIILDELRQKMSYELAQKAKNMEEEAKDKALQKAREVILGSVQRIASEYTAEVTVSAVPLPSEEIKGKIIGREGRNIRTFETATGVDLLVDDTPEVVTISCFDPVRREIGKLALEKLITDGRIHPGRIEEVVEQATREFEDRLKLEGDQALLEVGLQQAKPELVKLLGRLRFRTSYGQNVLAHSIEVAMLSAHMANELGLDARKAKRAGIFHDIGKAVDREREGSHDELGAEILRKNGEPIEVIEAARLHHSDIAPTSVYAVLVQAADAISASRPGARRESFEAYIQRLESLETIAKSFRGVEKTYAIQAGREIRVIVKPKDIDDVLAYQMARDIAARIENELTYPGTIKVTVIREVRYTENAK
ncbi:MAG TPA: ribonuclease Y [Caldisericia bacterium]|nr:ribonuclease Y [Caldisericia bacterium]HOR46496.1 ribonuclease Y [Caldisericia bacterium]HOU08357.1 ribonuclease Y [Caldisericia bacterium]HPL89024.1 ribonuclease Y [Caldisericia bacterium]HQG60281.1 ribonuclease Y [Caldisericia bacterium]